MKVELDEIGEWIGMGWMEWHYALDWVKITMRYAMRCPKMKQESKDKESG